MAINLLNLVKDQLSGAVLSKAASLVGMGEGKAGAAITSMLPALLGGIGKKASTTEGASSLLSLIKDNNLGEGTLNNLGSSLSGAGSQDFLKKGGEMASSLFGSDHGSMLSKIGSLTGAGSEGAGKLMSLVAPVALGALGKVVKTDNLDAAGLKSYLGSQTANFASNVSGGASVPTASSGGSSSSGGGGGMLKWLLPLLLVLGALYWFMGRGGSADKMDDTKTEQMDKTAAPETNVKTGGHTHADGTYHEGSHDHGTTTTTNANGVADRAGNAVNDAAGAVAAGATTVAGEVTDAANAAGQAVSGAVDGVAKLMVDDTGNLVTEDGKIIAKAGEFTEKDGAYFDKDGKPLGNFIKKVGKAIEGGAKKIGGAIKKGANKVGDAVKNDN